MSQKEEQKAILVGRVTHYFNKIGVAIIKLSGSIKVGDKVKFVGFSTNFEDEITSIEVEKKKLDKADAPFEVGVKVKNRVREGDRVYLL